MPFFAKPPFDVPMTTTLPPRVPVEDVAAALVADFGVSGMLTPLDGERDQNFRLDSAGTTYVVKVGNLAEGFALASAQMRALGHIAAVDAGLPVPRAVAPSNGSAGAPGRLTFAGQDYPLTLLTWLEGSVMGDTTWPLAHYRALGGMIGRLTRSLRGFSSAALAERALSWNTAHFAPAAEDRARVGAGDRELVDMAVRQFGAEVQPRLPGLPAQVIHGDVHPFNTLVGPDGGISGIIDFGDMIHAPRVLDISNALADCLLPGEDIAAVVHAMLAGYAAVVPLEEDEVACILPLMQARLAMTALITAARRAAGAAVTPQIAALDAVSFRMLRLVQDANLEPVIRRAAAGIEHVAVPAATILRRRLEAMGPKPLLFYDEPLHMLRGEGVWLTASDGRRYLDCYNNVPHVGHSHPHVVAAVSRQLQRLNTNTRYLTDEAITYAERLKETLDPSLDTVIFVNSGSEANDVAWRMANAVTGHTGALCMDFAYHGVTMAADMLSPSNYPPGKWHAPRVRLLEPPDTYRGPLCGKGADAGEAYAAMADAAIRDLSEAGPGVAIAILDSAFMTNGILDAPPGYVAALAARARKAGGLFVADEVQSGFGRMGSHMWGHQRHGIVPDFVTIGKPAGNGYPVGAVITRSDILARFVSETGPFFSTFGGGNAACAAGLAVLDVISREDLVANSFTTGRYLSQRLSGLRQKHALIGDVRGAGLAIGVELVRDRQSLEPAGDETRRIINALRHEGVLIGSDGKWGNVLKIRPPLVFRPEHADLVADALDRVLGNLPPR